jgi:hypothetical protein
VKIGHSHPAFCSNLKTGLKLKNIHPYRLNQAKELNGLIKTRKMMDNIDNGDNIDSKDYIDLKENIPKIKLN